LLLPAGWKRGEALAALLSLLEQRRVRRPLGRRPRRTYWEPCAKGNEARREWAPAFEAMVKGNEQEAADYWDRQSKKEKDRQRWRRLGESKIFSTIDLMHQQLLRYRELELRVEIPPALFKCGQSVLQWWAPWMKDANHSQGKVLPESGLMDPDFWEDFNTRNVGRSSTGRDVAVKEPENKQRRCC